MVFLKNGFNHVGGAVSESIIQPLAGRGSRGRPEVYGAIAKWATLCGRAPTTAVRASSTEH